LTAFVFVCYSIHKIIYVSYKKHLFDEPSEDRKIHLTRTPNLGGVAIFASMMLTSSLFLPNTSIHHLNYIMTSAVILFFSGLTDDLVGMNPNKKILAQLVVALIITLLTGYRFTSFHGFFGLKEMPYLMSVIVSTLFILLLINAFNLIDGINCLAGSIGLLACLTFAYCFWRMHETGFLYLAIALSGCLVGFLFYNRTPAKIFMGDTGALFLGFIIAVFAIHFIELNKFSAKQPEPDFKSAPAIVFGLLIIPIFDTLRVFSLRIMKRKSPFHADRNHIHHRLIDLKFSHLQSTGILLLANVTSLSLVFWLRDLGTEALFLMIAAFSLILNGVLGFIVSRKTRKDAGISRSYSPQKPVARFLIEAPTPKFLGKQEIRDPVKEL
jgi:UDP-N-acetylmuramyl pentapeptide phosphotransferase/UDP-N-acetylglucosamine-1-phosphate transferase